MTHWKIYPGVDNESTTGFQIYTTQDGRDPKTMMLQIADTGTIGLGTPPTDGVRLTVDGKVTATTFSGDGGALTVGGQGLTQTLAGLRMDVDASAPLTGATFRGAVTAPSFGGDGGGLTVGGQGLTQTLAGLRTDVEARAPLAGATFRGAVTATTFSGDGGALTVSDQGLAAALAGLRTDVEARAPLAGATITGPLTVNAVLTVGAGQLTTLGGDLTVKGNVGILAGNQSVKGFDSTYAQITFGYNFTTTYRHAIKTRHDSTQQPMNAIDFYVWQPTDNAEAIGTLHTMSLNGGNVGIGTPDPAVKLQVTGPVMQQLDVIPCNNRE